MNKSEARKLFTARRKETTHQQRIKWDDLILIQFQNLPLQGIGTLFTYAAMEREVNTDPIVDFLHFRHPAMQVAYPVCDFQTNTMQAIATAIDTPFIQNQYGTPEPQWNGEAIVAPETIDVIIIPLLCFDEMGYRVGYGKGFYDKFLAHTRSDVVKVGLSYYEPVNKIDDRTEFDVPLSYCVTPEKFYEF